MPGPRGPYRKRRRRGDPPPVDDSMGFGGDDQVSPTGETNIPLMASGELSEEPPPELVALGDPPEDTLGARKWQHRMYMTMVALTIKDSRISNETRMKRLIELNNAAAKVQDDAARYDLDQRISRDAEELAGKKRARAAAKMERRPPAGGAKVIPIRPDA